MIGIGGLGFVGSAIYESFRLKNLDMCGYDKFKNGGIGTFEDILKSHICFLCLPTLYDDNIEEYDKDSILETLDKLDNNDYKGLIVIKSTVEPETTYKMSLKYPKLRLCNNPEFLSARTAFIDFHNQTHIVIGSPYAEKEESISELRDVYAKNFPDATISVCTSTESESMKIMCNTFYASKIAIFNEFYLVCEKNGSDFQVVRDLMLKNNWINPMHTEVPGSDGQLGFGGACFPKDTAAISKYMKRNGTPNRIIEAVIEENKVVRSSAPIPE